MRKARGLFLTEKGRTIDPDGRNMREEHFNCFLLLCYFIILFHHILR